MYQITKFNTWIGSNNLGDRIIMDACDKIISEIFSNCIYFELSTHDYFSFFVLNNLQKSSLHILCGTNILNQNMFRLFRSKSWYVHLWQVFFLRDVVLLGVGSGSYGMHTGRVTAYFWKRVLSKKYIHSVRDSYTKELLKKMGIENVIVTGCPTLWEIDTNQMNKIPARKADRVVCTVTNYDKNLKIDSKFISIVGNLYEKVYLWPQSYEDIFYIRMILKEISIDLRVKIEVMPPNLSGYNSLLDSGNIDYVGTRLHAGIRALQKNVRTIIIGIDNRAIEMKEFGLPVLDRKDLDQLENLITSDFETALNMPKSNQRTWVEQFIQMDNPKVHPIFKWYRKGRQKIKDLLIR